jgi:hypothetical protein
MDVYRMTERLGPEFMSADLYNVLKCPECKGRKFLFMLMPVHFSYGYTGSEIATP